MYSIIFGHVNRSQNGFAHLLARIGLHFVSELWFDNFPSCTLNLAFSDGPLFVPLGKFSLINEKSFLLKRKKIDSNIQ